MTRPMKFNDLTRTQKEDLIEDLNAAVSMEEFLGILQSTFKLDLCKPGSLTKGMLSNQMVKIVLPMINPEYNGN